MCRIVRNLRPIRALALLLLLTALIPRLTPAQVNASLVSADATVQLGKPFVVALRLEHEHPWHTYWLNPGTGRATSLEWTLPEGWRAGEIEWPTPIPILGADGSITGHGYEGVVYLPVTITPSRSTASDSATLVASVHWLMCTIETCIPDKAELRLALPVSSGPPAPNAGVRAELAKIPMPKMPPKTWTLRATRTGDRVSLQIEGAEDLTSPHFFSATELIQHEGAQKLETAGRHQILTLPINEDFEGEQNEMLGVLVYTDASGDYTGVDIRVPFVRTGAATTSPGSTAGSGGSIVADSGVALTTPAPTRRAYAGAMPLFLMRALGLAFLGGLILNLMPCVLPILSLKALSLTHLGSAGSGAERQGLLYTAGVLVSFAVAAAGLIALRTAADSIGWGFHLQNPYVVLGLALVMAAVGFNLLGVFEFGSRLAGSGQSLTESESGRAAFFTGVLAVVVATPCTAPFMAAALGYALVQPAATALAVFLALGLGFAAPFLLVSLWPAARRALPRPGAWMLTFKQALAFPMFLTAAWLLWVLGGQTGVNGMAVGVVAITLLGVCVWALGRSATGTRPISWRLTAATSLVVMFGSISFGLAAGEAPERRANISGTDAIAGTRSDYDTREIAYTREALQRLLSAGRPVFAYFTADWCVSCKVNERVAIQREETKKLFTEKNIAVVVGDWTLHDPAITAMLSAYGRAGVPMYLYFPAGSTIDQGRLLPQILTPAILRSSLE